MSAEKLYQQVKSGKVKLDQLNDEGKKALKDYMATKNSEVPPRGPRQGTYPELQQFGRAALSVGKSLGGVAKKFGGDIKESVRDSAAKGREKKAAEKSKPFGQKVLGTTRAIGRDLKDFERGFYNTLTFGGTDAIDKKMEIASQEQIDRAKGSLAGKIGGFAGYVGPGGVADAAASALVRPLVRNAPKLVQGLTRLGTGGALFQGAIEGGEALRGEQQSLGGRALDIGFSGAFGGGLGAAGPLAKGLLNRGTESLRKTLEGIQGNQMRAIESTMRTAPNLELPAPRVRGNANNVNAPDVINVPETGPRGLPGPSIPQPKEYDVYRRDAKGAELSPSNKPHGLYLSLVEDKNKFKTPFEDVGDTDYWGKASPKNPLTADEIKVKHARFGSSKEGIASAGVSALKKLVPENEFNRLLQLRKDDLIKELNIRFPGSDYTKYHDSYELLEVLSSKIAKSEGYDAIILYDRADPDFSEMVALDDGIVNFGKKEAQNLISEHKAAAPVERVGRAPTSKVEIVDRLPDRPIKDITPSNSGEPAVLNSSAGRQPQPIKLDEEVIKFNESGVGNADTFGSKISTGPAKKKGSVSKWWEKTRTELVDDVAPFEGFEKRVTGSVSDAEDSLYKSARMFKGTPERAAQVVQDRLSPIVKGIEKSGYAADDLGKYALAVHARDVNAAGIKSGFTNAEIDDVISKLGTPEMEAARKELIQINRDMLNENVAAGNVSKELASLLEERWKNYIPLFRDMDDEAVDFATGLSNSLANVANPIKALKGSEKKVIDPLENMVKNIFQSINSAERNKVASQLHRLNEIDTDNNFIRKLGKGEDVGRKNVVNVRVNGDNVKYEVEPEVYKAMLNLDQESSNMITNILSKPAALLRAGATLTPEFSLRNPMRDVVQAFVVSKSGFNPITDFGAGLIQTISKGKLYKEWIDNLGAYGNVMSMDRNVHRQALEKVLKQPLSKKFVNIITGKSLIRALRYITDTTESATKVGEYRAALRKGVSKQEAAYRSRDIMDFARAGSGVRQANKMVAFLNANIQGKSKLIRAIKENPAGTITRAFTAVTVPTVGIYVLNKQFANDTQRETIDNAPDWMRNSFWLMAIPGTDVVARIPKPFDLAAIFSNLPERALDFAYDNDKEAFDGFVSRTLKESALPMQISGLIPFIEGMANYSFFREGDIIPQRESGLEYEDQYDPVRTTETGKFLARGAELLTGGKGAFKNFSSPRVMDNTIQGLTAGLGKYGTDAIDFILQKTGAVDRPVAPEKSIEQKPFAKAFLVDPNQGGKEMDEFYSTIDKLSKEKSSNKLNDESFGKTGKTTDYLPWDKNSLLKDLNAASDDVSDINKEIRAIEKDTLLNAHQKKMKIDRLISDRKNIVKESVKLIK